MRNRSLSSTFVAQCTVLNMLEALITSKTRLKLLVKFFVLSSNTGYLRGIAEEFDESTNAIRRELNQLAEAGFLERKLDQNKVLYRANTSHPLFESVQHLVRSFLGIDEIIFNVLERVGDVETIVLIGSFERSSPSDIITLVFRGSNLKRDYLTHLAVKASKVLGRDVQVRIGGEISGPHIVLYKNATF